LGQPILTSLDLPELKAPAGQELKVAPETQILYDCLKTIHVNGLASARLQLSLAKKLQSTDPQSLWTKYRESILSAAKSAMGAKFNTSVDDFYKLDARWKEETVTAICRGNAQISAELQRCKDQGEFLAFATQKTSASLNTVKSNVRAECADIVKILPELSKLIKSGMVGPDGEPVDAEEAQPVHDAVMIAQRTAAAVKERLKDCFADLCLSDAQLDKFVVYVSDLQQQKVEKPNWLVALLKKSKSAADMMELEEGDD